MRALIGAVGIAFVLVSAATARQDPTIVINPPEKFTMRVLATSLDGPWEITWGPDQQIWATERRGRRVIRINPADGTRTTLLSLPEAHTTFTQDGLLGLALHPDLLKGLVATEDLPRGRRRHPSIGAPAGRLRDARRARRWLPTRTPRRS